jgi:alpha-galactosidase
MKAYIAMIMLVLGCMGDGNAQLSSVTPKAADEARRWVGAKFLGQPPFVTNQGYLLVYTRGGDLDRNSFHGKPLLIGSRQFRGGLHFSAGKVVVRLPRPARSLEAVVGADSSRDEFGYGGRGSFILSVQAQGSELYRSEVMHEGMTGVPIRVNLQGANEFALELTPVGAKTPWDFAGWDQADWAEARVTLEDGSSLALADLPIGPPPSPYTLGPPFAFRYGDRGSSELLKTWEFTRSEARLDSTRTKYVLTYRDPRTSLVVRCEAMAYADFPTVEWTVYFKNEGTQDAPILEQIQALDTQFERRPEGEFILHHAQGSQASPTDFRPLETLLEPRADERLATGSGRATEKHLCYFNVEWPGQGVIIGLGWPGDWAAQFTRDEGRGLRVRAGQELTHFKLLPGEEVRSPLVALQFYDGDWISAQNVWRRWMIAHNLPRIEGKLPTSQLAAEPGVVTNLMMEANESNMRALVDRYLEERIPLDAWWMDAGWYPFHTSWGRVGTWEPDPQRFPRGLRAITDYAHSKGIQSIVWFEPERVAPGTWLAEKHPEWLLGKDGGNKLLDLGNPEAWHWLVEHISGLLRDQGIDYYRQDFNFDPLPLWRAHDAEDRQGITEIRHVTGYLAYWDELRRRLPNLRIDTCASGGRRDDLETLRRAVPLWRSDFVYDPTAMQNITYGMALWIPYFGTGINEVDPYTFRSDMCPAVVLQVDVRRKDLDYDLLRRMCSQWRAIAEYYYGDYYPLTAYSTGDDAWAAFQFDRPESGDGMVQVFRRPGSPFEAARFPLRGLQPGLRYKVTNLDAAGFQELTGRELMGQGLYVTLKNRGQSSVIVYARIKSTP